MRIIFLVIFFSILWACAEDEGPKNYGSITLTPPANTDYPSITFQPGLDKGVSGESFSNAWYSSDPSGSSSGLYQVMNVSIVGGVMDHVDFFDRPEFSMPTSDTFYLCNAVNCPNLNVMINTVEKSIRFNDFILPQFSNSSGRDVPIEYTINGTLYY